MLRNYLKIAIRNLLGQKIYSVINVLGLAISIAACLLIVIYVKHETSYDSFFPDKERIYKISLERIYPNHSTLYGSIPHSYADAMLRDFPEVENVHQMQGAGPDIIIKYKLSDKETKIFEEDNFLLADSAFFFFFDVGLVKGDKNTAMAHPKQVIISETTAKRYFGDEEALGKVISGDFEEMKVTGVFKDLPENSHLKFDAVCSFSGAEFRKEENYISFDSWTYVKLKPGTDAQQLESKFPEMVNRYASGQIERELGQSWADYQKAGNGYRYFLQPLTSIHLDPRNIEFTVTAGGNLKYIYALSFIAILILIIACINFMNLATARSSGRAREVGLRKVMGSVRNQLVLQFLVEAILLAFLSTGIAVLGASLALPAFNSLVEKQLHIVFTTDVIAGLIGFALVVGVLAGFYPAVVLSSFNPVEVMKGNFARSSKGSWLRNGLVVFQFGISIVLITGTIVVGSQMDFMQKKDLGFDKEQVLILERAWALDKKSETFINELKKIPGVESAASTSSRVGNRDDFFGQMFQPEGSNEVLTVKSMVMDDDFANVIDFKLKEGRFFSRETSDSLNIILNEKAVQTIGLVDPVGKRLTNDDFFRWSPKDKKVRLFTIVGVAKDFHFQSLRDEITPLVIFSKEIMGPQGIPQRMAIKIKPDDFQAVVGKVEAMWKEFAPERPIHYEFLDDNLKTGYSDEQRSSKMFTIFSGLAIIIACVGLFGLSAFTASQRTKEIGIRKVLGASVGGVVMLLTREFTKLVLIAFVLAVPLSWWMMSQWLGTFAYRIGLGVSPFVTAGLLALAIAWLTISYQSVKAAVVNPVTSLKSE
jgi:putative ABC transport system permease protein